MDIKSKHEANVICDLYSKRTLASMDTHDLDTIQGPFTYEALPHKDIKFIPLNQTKEVDGDELMELYDVSDNQSMFFTRTHHDMAIE